MFIEINFIDVYNNITRGGKDFHDMSSELDCHIAVSEFKIQSRYYTWER